MCRSLEKFLSGLRLFSSGCFPQVIYRRLFLQCIDVTDNVQDCLIVRQHPGHR